MRTGLFVLLLALPACSSGPAAASLQTREAESKPMTKTLRDVVQSWSKDHIDVQELLSSVRESCPDASDDEVRRALESVARGPYSSASSCAAAALCHLHGLDDPLDTAAYIFNESDEEPTEPQWFLWCAGYTYNWICNGGLSSCYYEFTARQYGDRIRVYDAIGATRAAEVMRAADRAFGEAGPPPVVEDRSQHHSDEAAPRLEKLNPEFWKCGDEILTRALLYALEHPEHFKPPKKWEPK